MGRGPVIFFVLPFSSLSWSLPVLWGSCEGRGVKPAARGLSPMAKGMTHGNARRGRLEFGSWASPELQGLPLVRGDRPGIGTEILDGAALVLPTLVHLTGTTTSSSGVAFIFNSCWLCREVCSAQEEHNWSQQLWQGHNHTAADPLLLPDGHKTLFYFSCFGGQPLGSATFPCSLLS